MAKVNYQLKNSDTELHVEDDPQILLISEIESQRDAFTTIQNYTDAVREQLKNCGDLGVGGPFATLADFDAALKEAADRLSDLAEYQDYGTKVINKTVLDGKWYTPASVDSFSSENVGEEAVLSIDDVNTTWWETTDVAASIVYRIKSFTKRYSKIRLRSTAGDLRAQLQGVNVRIANLLANIDEPTRLCGTFNFTHAGNDWIEAVFPSPKNGEWLKLDGFTSLHATPSQVRIREVDLFAIITNHET